MLPKIYSPGHVIQNWATVCSYMYIHCMLLFTFPEASTVRTKWSHLPLWRLRGGGAEGSERREDREGALSARPRNEGEGESRERGEVGWMNDQRKDIKSREGGLGWVGGGRVEEGGTVDLCVSWRRNLSQYLTFTSTASSSGDFLSLSLSIDITLRHFSTILSWNSCRNSDGRLSWKNVHFFILIFS